MACPAPLHGWSKRVSQNFVEVGDITMIQIFSATHGSKLLRSDQGGVVQSIEEKGPALPQPFELSSASEKY
ncbi:hypothetical protein TNCV_3823151 [Trichonephila clavipes]|nr:hypothetical protein TNCV_3823151 [Trichonephila clavipes]